MAKNRMRLLSLFMCCLLWLWLVDGHAAPDLSKKSRELSVITQQIQQLETKLQANRSERDVLVQELQETETRIGQLKVQLSSTRERLEHQRKILSALHEDVEKQEATLQAQQKLLGKQLRAAYQLGHHEYAKLILNQENPGQLSRLLDYYEYVSVARNDLIHSVRESIAKLALSKKAMAEQAQELERLLAEKKQEVHQLVNHRAYRQSVLTRQEKSITTKQNQLENLSHNKEALEKLIQQIKLQAMVNTQEHFKNSLHQLPLPTVGKVVNHFGQPISGSELLHNGILIQAPLGQKVEAVQSGKVVFAEWMRGFGLLMIIDHGHGYLSLYAHNESLYKKPGDMVMKGEKIASVGQSGGFKQSGLYFEIRRNGKPLNPMTWIKSVTV